MAEELTQDQIDAGEVPEDKTVGEDINLSSAVDDLAASLKLADAPVEAPKDDKAAPTEDKPAEAAAPVEDKAAAPTTAVVPAEDRAPDTWRKEAQAAWANVDPTVKAEIAKREADIARYVGEVGPSVNVAKNLEKVLEPFAPVLAQYNINPWDHISALFNAHYQLVFGKPEAKVQMMRQLCQDIGLKPEQLTDPNARPDAGYEQLRTELRNRDARIAALERGVTGVTSSIQEQRLGELSQTILDFRADTEAHPFFDELMDEMNQLIDTKAARNLTEAYEMAELRNPETRAKRLELDRNKANAAQAAAEATRAAAARKATGANVVSRGSGRTPEPEETIEQTLRSTMKDIRSRTH